MRDGRARFYRLRVTYRVADDGRLVATGPPLGRARTTGEGYLYRTLARLAHADDAAIAAVASRLGPLGPLHEPGSLADERRFGWWFDEALTLVAGEVDELTRRSGGGMVAIPGLLSRTAHLLMAMAQIDPGLLTRLLDALEDDTPLTSAERADVGDRMWSGFLGAMARYDAAGETMTNDLARGDQPVRVAVPPGITAERLRLAGRFLETTITAIGREGGAGTVFEPGSIGRLATFLSPYATAGGSGMSATESVAAWRHAAREMHIWEEAVRLLRAMAEDPEAIPRLQTVFAELRRHAGLDDVDSASLPSAHATSADTLRGATASLLTLRLQQASVWPLPEGEVVGTFGRALWSLWLPITGMRPPRPCGWRAGCPRLLPRDGHGNRRYCEDHRKEARRERAERNRRRQRSERPVALQVRRPATVGC